MKKRYFYIIIVFIFTSCSKNDDGLRNNPFLPNFEFNTGSLINTNLPEYGQLKFPGNYIILNDPYGINGVVLYYAGGDMYSAFELTDPNHNLNSCSTLTVEGIIATCSCDDANSYDILSGLGREGTTGEYTLKRYFTEVNGNIIRVFNN